MLAICKEYKFFIQHFLLLSYEGALWILFWLASITEDLRVRYHLEKLVIHSLQFIKKKKNFYCAKEITWNLFSLYEGGILLFPTWYPTLFLSFLSNRLKKIGKYWLKTPLCPLSQITVSHILRLQILFSLMFLFTLHSANYLYLGKCLLWSEWPADTEPLLLLLELI